MVSANIQQFEYIPWVCASFSILLNQGWQRLAFWVGLSGMNKIPHQHLTFGHLGPPSLPVNVHHLSPSGFETLIVNRDDRVVDWGTSFWTRALDTWSLCICWTDVVQTGGWKKKTKEKVRVWKCVLISKPKRGVVNTHQVTVVKFLGPEVCHFYFRHATAGKFSIFSRKKKSRFQSHEYW